MARIIRFRPRQEAERPQAAASAACVGNTVVIRFPGAEGAIPSLKGPIFTTEYPLPDTEGLILEAWGTGDTGY